MLLHGYDEEKIDQKKKKHNIKPHCIRNVIQPGLSFKLLFSRSLSLLVTENENMKYFHLISLAFSSSFLIFLYRFTGWRQKLVMFVANNCQQKAAPRSA